jgi:hypothetical protein
MLGGTYSLYRKLRDEGYPRDNYRLLCYNCNCVLGLNRITEEELAQMNREDNKMEWSFDMSIEDMMLNAQEDNPKTVDESVVIELKK